MPFRMLAAALSTVLGFLLGLRLGIALGYRGERRRREELLRAQEEHRKLRRSGE